MRLLITGGAGFIGSNLARLAASHGHEVVIIDNLATGYRDNVDTNRATFHEIDITATSALQECMQGVDSVIHLAALGSVPRSIASPIPTHETNVNGTLSVLEAARHAGVPHIVMSSSSSVYGANPTLPKSERQWVRPLSPYAASKLAGEQYLLAYGSTYNISTLAFRFFNVFGPGQRAGHAYAAVIPVFIDAILSGRPMPINGDGKNSRDFTYVGTVCEVLLDAATRRVSHPEPVNLAFGTNTNLNALTEQISAATGLPANIEYRPPRPGDVKHSQAENATLKSLFPDVRPVDLTEGLQETVAWFNRNALQQ